MTREPPSVDPIVGVLLAGGLSRRMGGGDKSLCSLCGVSLLERVVTRFRPQADVLVLNANGNPARFQEFGLPVLADTFPGFVGPLAGVLAGMIWARENCPQARYIATAACDTPFFPRNLVATLGGAVGARMIAVAACRGRVHPTFALWSVELAQPLEAAIAAGRRRLFDWVSEHNGIIVEFEPSLLGGAEIDPFLNINSPDDLGAAEQFLATKHFL